jgi:roadblock/LC7 domain-containing protein
LTSATPEERGAVANAVMDVFAVQKEDPEFINRARVALDGMMIGGAVEKGVEYIVRASKMIPWDRLQESIVQAGGRADERLASMAAGTTLSANPVGAAGDLALSAAGRVIGKQNVEEYPNSLTTMLYNVAEAPAKPKGARKWTKALLGRQMQEAAEKSGQSILKYDDAALDTLSTRMADEAIAALKKEGNASDWYNSKITEMNNVLQKLHPELESGTTEEGIFKAGLALTSNGATVDYNLKAAEHVYTVFKASGKFPEDLKSLEAAIGGFGQEGPTLVKQFARANDMIAEMGADKFVEFLNTKFTVKELTQLGFKLSGEAVDFETYGSAIFGPKIGGGFYQNLRGNFNPVTFDRWWMASWGRWTGQPLLKTTGKARTDQLNRFRAASGKKYKDPQKAIAAAKKIYATYRKNNFQPRTELNQSAQRLAEGATDKMREQPAGPSERTFMRNVTYATVEKLKSMGYNLTPADLQATVWYPEKELHGFYGIGSGRSAPDDYAAAATRLLGERNAKR